MKILSKFEWTILAIIFVYSFIPTFGGLLRVLELVGGPEIIPENPRAVAVPFPVVIHILSSFLFCLAGAFQFMPSIRRRRPATHRMNGRIVAIAGCVSAVTGVWMTQFFAFPAELQGKLLYLVRIILGFSMLGLIGWSMIAIQSRNVIRHSSAMLRAYAIGQGASTQTFFGIGWVIVSGTEPSGLFRDGLMVSAWGLNLLAAEILIWKQLSSKRLQTKAATQDNNN